MKKTVDQIKNFFVSLWYKYSGKKPIATAPESKIFFFQKSIQHLITARHGLKQYGITIDVSYKGTHLKSAKNLFIKVLLAWKKDAEFIEDKAAVETYQKAIEKAKKEL